MAAERVTLADVAAAVGTSTSTVSRALHKGAGVRPEVVERIRVVADRLGYQVNQQARGLRRGRDEAIGLVVEDFAIPFFGTIASVIERRARGRGMGMVIACSGTDSSEEAAVASLLSRNVAGLVVAGGTGRAPEGFLGRTAREIPLVVFDAAVPVPDADTVTVDNVGGGRSATAALLDEGHREVIFVGSGPSSQTVRARRQGYLEALMAAGITPREQLTIWAGHSTAQVQDEVARVLPHLPEATAVFSSGARTTPGTLIAMARTGRDDMSFCGMDEVEGAEAFTPALTVVRQELEEIGERTTDLLLDRLDGYAGPARHVEVPMTFVDRGSTGRRTAHI